MRILITFLLFFSLQREVYMKKDSWKSGSVQYKHVYTNSGPQNKTAFRSVEIKHIDWISIPIRNQYFLHRSSSPPSLLPPLYTLSTKETEDQGKDT